MFVCLLLIIGDNSLRYKSKKNKKKTYERKKKNIKKRNADKQKKKRKTLNNCFSTISFFFSLIVNIFVRFLPSCKERSVEQKGAGSIKRY